jgi:glycerol uptake facilitator protein
MKLANNSLSAAFLAEALGTFVLVFLGCGAVHAAVLAGAQSGLWQVAIVWGAGVMLAVYLVGGVSGAHVNPAITAALAVWRGFPRERVPAYVLGQLAGAFAAALVLFLLFGGHLEVKEAEKNVRRGWPGSELTAMCYGEYFPNPGPLATRAGPYTAEEHARFNARVGHAAAFVAELVGTALLALVVFAVTDPRNVAAPAARLGPVFIGLAVAAIISVIGPLTQACLNPARDFGPRLLACAAGWGEVALPGPRGMSFLTVYVLAPVAGAVLGGGLYERVLRPALPDPGGAGAAGADAAARESVNP